MFDRYSKADPAPKARSESRGRGLFAFALAAGLSVWAAPASPARAAERWVPLGPSGGLVRDLAQAPSDRNRLYAITEEAATGLFRSRDGGLSWQAIDLALDHTGYITVSVAPRDPDFVLLSSGSGRIWRSRDGGTTWTAAVRPPRIEEGELQAYQMFFAPGTEKRIYAATPRGIFRSLDGGSTWDSWALPNVFVIALARNPAVPGSWFASGYGATETERGVFRSDDGGKTWSRAASVGIPSLDAPGRLYFHSGVLHAQWNGVLYRTTDGAATWSLVARPPTFFAYDYALSRSGSIYAATERGVYSSTDGVTWSPPDVPPGIDQAVPGDVVFRLALLPRATGGREADAVVACGRRGIWRSADGGTSWAPSSRGLAVRTVAGLVALPDAAGTVVAGFEDGLYRIERAGEAWRRLPRQAGFEQPYLAADPHRPGRLFGLGAGFGASEDQGKTWTTLGNFPHGGVTVFKADPGQPGVIWAGITLGGGSSENGFAFVSRDGGRTWTEFQSFNYLYDLAFDPAHPKVIYRLTSNEGLGRSDDGGLTWRTVQDLRTQLGAEPTGLLFEPRSRALYATTDQRGVFRSTDAGRTFRRVSAGLPVLRGGFNPYVSGLVQDAAGDLYASLWNVGVYRLRPGEGWTPVNDGLPVGKFVGPVVADPDRPGLLYAPTFGASVLRLENR